MGYERYGRDDQQRGYRGRDELSDYGRGRGSGDDRYGYSTAGYSGREEYGRDGRTDEQRAYGAPRPGDWGDQDDGQGRFDAGRDYHRSGQNYGAQSYGAQDYSRSGQGYGSRDFARDPYRQARGTYNRQPQDYGDRGRDNDRGFFDRAGDEVRSWFGDEEAERRREADARRDEQNRGRDYGRDEHYHSWRNQQIAAFDRDYDEYRQENQSRFHNEFSSWRSDRQGQRDLLSQVQEHADVVGSDGEHVGTVDKVRGDRIILTKSDADAGGRHHSVPSRWLQSADGNKVTLRKTAAEAKAHWRDEERQEGGRGALFGQDGDRDGGVTGSNQGTNLNRSFSGTY